MDDFWISSGHHLLDRDEHGFLVVSDEFLKAYLARPEMLPPPDACADELALHRQLLAAPRRAVTVAEIDRIKDRDGRENWQVFLRFRDLLLASSSLEAAYLAQFRSKNHALPWLFANQLAHLILRNALDEVEDAFVLRAAEMFFRRQKLSQDGGRLLLGDADVIEERRQLLHDSPLLAMFQNGGAGDLDILDETNVAQYRRRSDAFDMVVDFRPDGAARVALGRVIEIWLHHLMGLDVKVSPLERLTEVRFTWFVGLDQEATGIGNALWKGAESAAVERVIALYRLDFAEPHVTLDHVAGEPVYLVLAVDGDHILHMKPQNLITGLPLKEDRRTASPAGAATP